MERLLAVGRIFYIVESRQRPRPALELIVESTADWQPPDPPVLQVVGISRVFPLRLVLRGKTGERIEFVVREKVGQALVRRTVQNEATRSLQAVIQSEVRNRSNSPLA
jgi:hypothetical protein